MGDRKQQSAGKKNPPRTSRGVDEFYGGGVKTKGRAGVDRAGNRALAGIAEACASSQRFCGFRPRVYVIVALLLRHLSDNAVPLVLLSWSHETAANPSRVRHNTRRTEMSRRRSKCKVAAALLCLTLPRLGAAQETSAGGSAQREAALQALRPGHLVRISANGLRDTGRVAVASSNQLAFRHRYPDAMPASSIDSLWTWKSNVGSGALIGASIVGALGAFAGYSIGGIALDYEPSASKRLGPAAAVGIVGGLVGALVGGTIGSVTSHWTLVHPRRP